MSITHDGAGPYAELLATCGLGASGQLMLDEVRDGARVLDVGCATGYIAERLAARGCTVTGVERNPRSAAVAREHCEDVIVGDVESAQDRARIPAGFEFVLLGDVLEHLIDPWDTLRFMRTRAAPDGVVVVSIPNVAAWTVRLALLRGSWKYTETGLLDRTHLRFFTRATVHRLARDAGFAIERERFVPIEAPAGPLRRALPGATGLGIAALLRVWPELMAQQFVLRLRVAREPA